MRTARDCRSGMCFVGRVGAFFFQGYTSPGVQVKAAGACSTLDRILEVKGWGITRVGTGQTGKVAQDAMARFGN